MSQKPENPPAFPSGRMEGFEPARFPQYEGLTTRDYFAAAALQGLLADSNVPSDLKQHGELMARSAFCYADAMLAERAKA